MTTAIIIAVYVGHFKYMVLNISYVPALDFKNWLTLVQHVCKRMRCEVSLRYLCSNRVFNADDG